MHILTKENQFRVHRLMYINCIIEVAFQPFCFSQWTFLFHHRLQVINFRTAFLAQSLSVIKVQIWPLTKYGCIISNHMYLFLLELFYTLKYTEIHALIIQQHPSSTFSMNTTPTWHPVSIVICIVSILNTFVLSVYSQCLHLFRSVSIFLYNSLGCRNSLSTYLSIRWLSLQTRSIFFMKLNISVPLILLLQHKFFKPSTWLWEHQQIIDFIEFI